MRNFCENRVWVSLSSGCKFYRTVEHWQKQKCLSRRAWRPDLNNHRQTWNWLIVSWSRTSQKLQETDASHLWAVNKSKNSQKEVWDNGVRLPCLIGYSQEQDAIHMNHNGWVWEEMGEGLIPWGESKKIFTFFRSLFFQDSSPRHTPKAADRPFKFPISSTTDAKHSQTSQIQTCEQDWIWYLSTASHPR